MNFLSTLLKKSAETKEQKMPIDLVLESRALLLGTAQGRTLLAYLHYEFGWGKNIETEEDRANHNMLIHLRSLCGINDQAMAGQTLQAEFKASATMQPITQAFKDMYEKGINSSSYEEKKPEPQGIYERRGIDLLGERNG